MCNFATDYREKRMNRKRKSIIPKLLIFTILSVFSIFSMGLVIVKHECCKSHKHTKNDHSHCHETYKIIKISNQYLVQRNTSILPKIAHPLTPQIDNPHCTSISYTPFITPPHIYTSHPNENHFQQNFLNLTSQRVFYC